MTDEPFTLAIRGRGDTHCREFWQDGTANAILTPNGGRGGIGVGAVCAFTCKDYGADATEELSPTLRAMGHSESHANAGGQLAVCVPLRSAGAVGANGAGVGADQDTMFTLGTTYSAVVCVTGEITHTLKAEGFDASEDGPGRGQPIVNVVGPMSAAGGTDRKHGHGWGQQDWENGYVQPCGAQVRRLTPTECARLQGFPDDYLKIPVKKVNPARLKSPRANKDYRVVDGEVWQLAADGPQYKALGNSMAVPVMAWIGRRIEQALAGPVTLEDLL